MHSRVWVYLLFDELPVTTLNSFSVYKKPMANRTCVELSGSQSKRAVDANFDVSTYRIRNVGFGPLGLDVCDSS